MVAVEIVHTVYVKAENKPGSLERIAKTLGEKRINIDALSVETVGPSGFARFLTTRSKEAVDALRAMHLEAYESPAVVVSLANKPLELARACGDLAASGLNVEGVITTTDGRVIVRTNDNDRAMQILRKI